MAQDGSFRLTSVGDDSEKKVTIVKKCKRHGCHKEYKEGEDEECVFHSGWPVFHDLVKKWTCCLAESYDWDDFIKLPGCCRGAHSDIPPEKPSPPLKKSVQDTTAPPPKLRSIEEFNKQEAPVARQCNKAEAKALCPIITPNGNRKCRHNGCHAEYDPNDNSADSCKYHPGHPIFHDLKKSWSCCKASSYDWEDFMQLPRCSIGPHSPRMTS